MAPLFLLLVLFAQTGATPQEPNGSRSSENAARLAIPIAVTIEGAEGLPANAGEPAPTIRLVPTKGGKEIETALTSKGISLDFTRGTTEQYRVQVENLPPGYTVKSMTFGSKDLTKDKLTTADLFTSSPRIPTYTGQGELQALIDSIMARQSRVLSITIAPSPTK